MRAARHGVSRIVVPVVIVVVLALAGAYVFLARGTGPSTSTTTSSTASLPTVPVNGSVDALVQDLNVRDVNGLVTLYNPNAVTVWFGSTGGLSGRYVGASSIKLIYATTVGNAQSLDANISGYAQKVVTPTQTNATFVVKLLANSSVAGIVHATIDVSEQWNWGGSGWQITKENWNYIQYDSSMIDAGIPSATTFPQWGYELKGGNPNLVSEKSFEWHVGPYVAASVYAFLFGVAALMVLELRSRRRAFGDRAPL